MPFEEISIPVYLVSDSRGGTLSVTAEHGNPCVKYCIVHKRTFFPTQKLQPKVCNKKILLLKKTNCENSKTRNVSNSKTCCQKKSAIKNLNCDDSNSHCDTNRDCDCDKTQRLNFSQNLTQIVTKLGNIICDKSQIGT